MRCPYCKSSGTKVVDKREIEDVTVTRRRRECLSCKKRFTTYERIETSNITVIKKDNSRETFDREKAKKGILRACEKRPVTAEQIEKVLDDLEVFLRTQESTEINSKKVGEFIVKQLKKLDKVAYIRFASVYKEFEDLSSFKDELERLIKEKK